MSPRRGVSLRSAGNRPTEAVPRRLPSSETDCFWLAALRTSGRPHDAGCRQDDRCHRRGTGTSTSAPSSTGNGSSGQPLFGGNQSVSTMRALFSGTRARL